VQWKLISTLIFINKQKLGCASLTHTWRICELSHRISGSPPQNLMFEPAFNPEMRCLFFSESVICMWLVFIYLFLLFMRIAERSSKRQLVSGRCLRNGMAHIIPEQYVNMGIVIISLALYSVTGQRPVTCMVKKCVNLNFTSHRQWFCLFEHLFELITSSMTF